MKTINGFVSNSSSASFIIKWKAKENLNASLCDLFCLDGYGYIKKSNGKYKNLFDTKINEFKWKQTVENSKWEENYYFNYNKEDIDTIIENTRNLGDGFFETVFFTCMMNDYTDFGESCNKFVSALIFSEAENKDIRIIEKKIDKH